MRTNSTVLYMDRQQLHLWSGRCRSSQREAKMESAAIAVLKRAVEMDTKKRFTESLVCYQEGLQLLMEAIKHVSDEAKRAQFRKKAGEYMDRAEKVKAHIEREKELGQYHEQIHIDNNSTGFSYASVMGRFLDDLVQRVEVEDPYIRAFHQCQNFLRLCELLVRLCSNLRNIILVTGGESSGRPSDDQLKRFKEIADSLSQVNVTLTVNFSDTLHDREIRLDTGWVIKIGRGLDYFKPAEGKLSLGACDMDLRRTHETTVDIFHTKNMK